MPRLCKLKITRCGGDCPHFLFKDFEMGGWTEECCTLYKKNIYDIKEDGFPEFCKLEKVN